MVTLLGVLSALSFGIGDFLARFSSREVGFKNSLFWMLVVGALFYLILFSIFLLEIVNPFKLSKIKSQKCL